MNPEPEQATFDAYIESDDYADVVFTVAHDVTGLKNGSATVNPDNYTISGNTITIRATYLASLTTGTKTFTIITDTANVRATVVVTDTTP